MALETTFSTPFPLNQPTDLWQLSIFPDIEHASASNFPSLSVFEPENINSQSPSPALLQAQIPQYVQPQELHQPSSPTESFDSSQSRHPSLDSLSSFVSLDRQQTLRRLSLASTEMNNDTYRPRNTPARRRKATTSRITPRSTKHARELELNRKAATKCRNRQKSFVENLQKRCRREEEKMHEQTTLVHALHDEVVALRNEVMRQSFCGCHSLRGVMPALTV
jgi:hypothetical protein